MFSNFDLDKSFDLHLDLPSAKNPPLCRIIQEDTDPILTTDFYLTNLEPQPWILPTPLTNNDTTTSSAAAAASNFTPEIPPDSVQPGEIRLYSWVLYMSCHQDGGKSQGDTRHSMPPVRRRGSFNLDV